MAYLLGTHNVARLNEMRVWAERGWVCVEDSSKFEKMSVATALKRIKAVNDMLGSSSCDHLFSHSLRHKVQSFVEDVINVIKQAKEQGKPGEKETTEEIKRRKPKTIIVPGNYGF